MTGDAVAVRAVERRLDAALRAYIQSCYEKEMVGASLYGARTRLSRRMMRMMTFLITHKITMIFIVMTPSSSLTPFVSPAVAAVAGVLVDSVLRARHPESRTVSDTATMPSSSRRPSNHHPQHRQKPLSPSLAHWLTEPLGPTPRYLNIDIMASVRKQLLEAGWVAGTAGDLAVGAAANEAATHRLRWAPQGWRGGWGW
jgi:hypothetical protein